MISLPRLGLFRVVGTVHEDHWGGFMDLGYQPPITHRTIVIGRGRGPSGLALSREIGQIPWACLVLREFADLLERPIPRSGSGAPGGGGGVSSRDTPLPGNVGADD